MLLGSCCWNQRQPSISNSSMQSFVYEFSAIELLRVEKDRELDFAMWICTRTRCGIYCDIYERKSNFASLFAVITKLPQRNPYVVQVNWTAGPIFFRTDICFSFSTENVRSLFDFKYFSAAEILKNPGLCEAFQLASPVQSLSDCLSSKPQKKILMQRKRSGSLRTASNVPVLVVRLDAGRFSFYSSRREITGAVQSVPLCWPVGR